MRLELHVSEVSQGCPSLSILKGDQSLDQTYLTLSTVLLDIKETL